FPPTVTAMTVVMILRVYAMWNRSKRTLWALLFIYVLQVIVSFISPILYLVVIQVLPSIDFSLCNGSVNVSSSWLVFVCGVLRVIPRFVLGATLLVLAVIQTLKQSVEMYKATRQWQPNRYMQQLVRDGIVYFLVNAFFNLNTLFQIANLTTTTTINGTSIQFLDLFSVITICPMMPRFIISVRELYDRDVRRRCQGIDSGFGVFSQPISSQNGAISAIAFAEVTPEQGHIVEGNADESEAMLEFEVMGDNTREV
ncbi:hypothetical protein J3R83DRAFT_11477, partial [Lanmaoa asiatica]